MKTVIFKDLNLSKEVQKAITEMGFEEATPIQSESIPHILNKRDVVGQAQTGTGKTCAFGIPAIEMIDNENEGIQVLVLCPTRELAIQTSEELKNVARYKEGIKILPVYGGQSIERQIASLRRKPQIVIGTPGRIMDHMRRHTLKLGEIKMMVLDEADEMLNMGFREDIDVILEKIPQEKQTILFSATIPKEILDLTKKYQKDPVLIKVAHKELTVPSIEQYYIEVKEHVKLDILTRVIDVNNYKLSLVFCNTKKKVDELASNLQSRGYAAEALHGDMRQEQRDKVMGKFRKGNIDILIATDVAARGIDVNDVEAVFNYDLPNDEEYYVHRIGRTGRAGKKGKAYSFAAGREIFKIKDIQRYIKTNIQLMKPPTLADIEESKMGNILNILKDTLVNNQFSKHAGYIERALEEINSEGEGDESSFFTTLDAAAALLKYISEKNGVQTGGQNADAASYARAPYSPEEQFDTGAEEGMVRLFINVGKKDKIEPRHIVEGIASSSGLPGKLVGAIDIYDNFTFVEIPKENASKVLASMKDYIIKGRRINIEASRKKVVLKRRV